ncbi:LysR family transcriptional regulator [Actibacterium lipolyticum]|uniref:HTH-type transcriptional regulator GbpR n=1 Tax=Actibacterium lipolyticum TaxID=1524263 RepID=A0A238KJK9_9RHOB|nr:LysR family transcriptional regulator [Actibacterium lipolyticum]SMX42973.1 HTH-type transcriptional regulator GbpR [Actibacterium lipolyticum]
MDLAKRLKPNQLRLLLKIAETGQLQLAANMVSISQPAASRILGDIEDLVGAALFIRHPKGMETTALGAICVRHAKVILEEMDALATEALRFTEGEIGHVRVGTVTGPAVGSLMPAIQKVKAHAPDIEMTIEVGPSTNLVRGLAEGRFDFVISRLPPGYDSRDFRMHPARSEEIALLVRPEHPLADQADISLSALLDFEWVVQELGSPIRQAVEASFLASNLPTPARVTNSSSLLVALSMLQGTDSVVPLTNEVANLLAKGPLDANVCILDLETPIIVSPCFVIQNRARQLSSAAERVFTAVLEWL